MTKGSFLPILLCNDLAGDKNSGLLLHRLLHWHDYTKIRRGSFKWVALSRYEWMIELKMSLWQLRCALKKLADKGLIVREQHKFKDLTVLFLRPSDELIGEMCNEPVGGKGPQVMRGYWQKPDANAAAFTMDGYLRTGDIGVFDAAGYLKIVDRKKDMIIVSGFNVYPNEVEAVAAACAGVAECACVGAPDEKTGEAVRLFAVKAPAATVCEADVIAHCRRQLAAYKVPKQVCFVEALPKSAVGKILRKDLRALK